MLSRWRGHTFLLGLVIIVGVLTFSVPEPYDIAAQIAFLVFASLLVWSTVALRTDIIQGKEMYQSEQPLASSYSGDDKQTL
ncbi:MAG: hypothetical protein GYB66_04110 [Chloroflexi bacterium]|nr:hypothetical protein [Chloroflexota bacterium]